jgi:hypothetical protein
MYLAVAIGFVVTLNIPLVAGTRALARNVTSRAERGREALDDEVRARLERFAGSSR